MPSIFSLKHRRGFTFVELLVAMALLALLASVVLPASDLVSRQYKERELKTALFEIRQALDTYKVASDAGKIPPAYRTLSGYPPNLKILEGLPSQQGRPDQMRFLRRVPRDPFFSDPHTPAVATWGLRAYASEADQPKAGEDVYDVFSTSTQSGLNGIAYREW